MTRNEAIHNGMKFYFTGYPCINGHVSNRYTSNGKCVECNSEYSKKPCHVEKQAARRASNKARQKEYYDKWIKLNRDKKLEYMRLYNKNIANKRAAEKSATDHVFNLSIRLRARVSKAFNRGGFSKNGSTEKIIGCSFEFLKKHIEKQFKKGMNWENRDMWHIDHITPISSAKTEKEIVGLCHFTNLRPIWADENRKKGSKKEFLI